MQRLWAGDRLTEDESQINQSSDGLALFLGCNSFVDYEMGRVLDVIKEKLPNAMVIDVYKRQAWYAACNSTYN